MTLERKILAQALEQCDTHAQALSEALEDLKPNEKVILSQLENLDKTTRRILDQFAYRFTRLQDNMGNKLLPAILNNMAEDTQSMAAIDRFNRLEQLKWLESSEEWLELRRVRNEFTHDYPEQSSDRSSKLSEAIRVAYRLLEIFNEISTRIQRDFILT
jgi:hypothetical protein